MGHNGHFVTKDKDHENTHALINNKRFMKITHISGQLYCD